MKTRTPPPSGFYATPAHVALWIQRRGPDFARSIRLPLIVSPDSFINGRAGIQWSPRIHNALSLACLVRRNCARGAERGTLGDYLRRYGNGGATSNERDRAPVYARWVRGLDRAERRARA
jgi:hypothetical protein